MSCPRLFEPVDAAHLQGCEECRAVQAALATPPAAAADLERLKGPALEELAEHPKARPWWTAALGLVAICVIAAGIAMQWLSANTVQHGSMMLRQVSAAAWSFMILAGAFLAVKPGGRGPRFVLFGALAACFAVTLAAASGVGPEGFGNVRCMLTEWAVAAVPFAVALAVLTGFAFDVTRALAAGVGATSAGMLALLLHCPNGTLQHQLAFHLLPILLLSALGLMLRSRLPSRTHAP